LLQECIYRGPTVGEEQEERNRWRKVVIEEVEEERARRVGEGEGRTSCFVMSEKRGSLQKLLEAQVQGAVTALHHEVMEYWSSCSEMQKERRPAQEAVLTYLLGSTSSLWPSASVEAYGSFATGLMGLGSDLDLVIVNWQLDAGAMASSPTDALSVLAAHLQVLDGSGLEEEEEEEYLWWWWW